MYLNKQNATYNDVGKLWSSSDSFTLLLWIHLSFNGKKGENILITDHWTKQTNRLTLIHAHRQKSTYSHFASSLLRLQNEHIIRKAPRVNKIAQNTTINYITMYKDEHVHITEHCKWEHYYLCFSFQVYSSTWIERCFCESAESWESMSMQRRKEANNMLFIMLMCRLKIHEHETSNANTLNSV